MTSLTWAGLITWLVSVAGWIYAQRVVTAQERRLLVMNRVDRIFKLCDSLDQAVIEYLASSIPTERAARRLSILCLIKEIRANCDQLDQRIPKVPKRLLVNTWLSPYEAVTGDWFDLDPLDPKRKAVEVRALVHSSISVFRIELEKFLFRTWTGTYSK